MSYLVIARKWRPRTFEDVVGQSHVTRTLQNAVASGRVAHAYLFTGPRGVGKTSTARILAKALNCEKGPTPHPCLACPACLEVAGPGSVDVIEVDGASNNSVDDIRSLREKVQYVGARDRYKVYIIDEVHMLSQAAFNALLKTLEEPPPHVVFIFATTEAAKVPPTILSRVQRFDFRRVGAAEVAGQLSKILASEGLEASDEALRLVARAGEGSVRDSQTLLDQVISYTLTEAEKRALRAEDVLAVLGGVQEGQAWGALRSALAGDTAAALTWLQEQYQRGADLGQVLEAFQGLLRGLLLLKAAPQGGVETELLPETAAALAAAAPELGLSRLFGALKLCGEAEAGLRHGGQPRLPLELLILELAPAGPTAGLGEIVDELRELEQRFRALPEGAFPPSAPAAGAAPALPAPPSSPPPAPASAGPVAPVPGGRPAVQSSPAPAPAPGSAASAASPSAASPSAASPSAAAAVSLNPPPAPPATIPAPRTGPDAPTAPAEGPAPDPLPPPPDAGEPVPAVQDLSEEEPSRAGAPGLDALVRDWDAVVTELQQSSLNLASAAKDAGLKSLDHGLLTLRAVNAFQRKVLEEPAEKSRLEQALTRRLGVPIHTRVLFEPPAPKAKGPKAGPPSKEEAERLRSEWPLLRRTQELFGAEIVEISED